MEETKERHKFEYIIIDIIIASVTKESNPLLLILWALNPTSLNYVVSLYKIFINANKF